MGERRRCPKGCGVRVVVDQFTEADHGLAGAQEWGVLELACGHYLEGPAHSAALCL
jgi:hypothetical protein